MQTPCLTAPCASTPEAGLPDDEVEVGAVGSDQHSSAESYICDLLQSDAVSSITLAPLEDEQRKDPVPIEVIKFLEEGVLPENKHNSTSLLLWTGSCTFWTLSGSTSSKLWSLTFTNTAAIRQWVNDNL